MSGCGGNCKCAENKKAMKEEIERLNKELKQKK